MILHPSKIDRDILSEVFTPLLQAMGIDHYGAEYSNPIFAMRRYCWCEEEGCPMCDNQVANRETTFFHKPTGFRLNWYKYAFRAVDVNQDLKVEQLKAIADDCIASLAPDLFTYEERLAYTARKVLILTRPAREALLIRATSTNPRGLLPSVIQKWSDEECATAWAAEQRLLVEDFSSMYRLRPLYP